MIVYNYYYHERSLSYEYVMGIPKFRNCHTRGIDYVENEDRLFFYLVSFYNKPCCKKADLNGYDSLYVSQLLKQFDFGNYDYIISYLKKISQLKYSPSLSDKYDDLYFDNRIPLIAVYEKETYDSLFIYKIKKNKEFRAPRP